MITLLSVMLVLTPEHLLLLLLTLEVLRTFAGTCRFTFVLTFAVKLAVMLAVMLVLLLLTLAVKLLLLPEHLLLLPKHLHDSGHHLRARGRADGMATEGGGDEVQGGVTAASLRGAAAIEGPGPITGGRGPSWVARGGPEWATWTRARVWRAIASPLSPPPSRLGRW